MKRARIDPKKALVICYHGTTAANAKSILREGFKPGTWFARHLEDAIGFGGGHVFEVAFPKHTLLAYDKRRGADDSWQFTEGRRISPKRIVGRSVYKVTSTYENVKLRNRVFESTGHHMTFAEMP
jgi:hypothetical protein